MPILERGEQNSVANPKLAWFGLETNVETFQSGKLKDPFSLEYEVWDISDAAKQTNPVNVVAKTAMNLVADKLGTGRFAPDFTLPSDEAIGRHEIRFYYTMDAGGLERVDRCQFDVVQNLSAAPAGPFYCFPSDLKDEGVCGKTDAFLLQRIKLASSIIDKVTGRFFEPRYLEIGVNGRGGNKLLLHMPIIGIQTVAFETSPFEPSNAELDSDIVRVYSRHLSQGLTMPDDRNNPMIELYHHSSFIFRRSGSPFIHDRLIFPRGQQNILVKGVFGYTDMGARSCGETPTIIRHIAKQLVIREVDKLTKMEKREDAMKRYRIVMEKTRDQQYQLEPLAAAARFGHFTGDPDIDTMLASFVRPPMLGAA